jgi:hypothetical protein
MDRAAIGLGSVFLHLGAEINWYRLFQELIAASTSPRWSAGRRSC